MTKTMPMTNQPFRRFSEYEISHIAFHLYNADQSDTLHQLLTLENSDGRNAWYVVKDKWNQFASYLEDLELGRRMAEKGTTTESDGFSGLSLQAKYALMFASVRGVARQYPVRLI